MSKMIKVKTEDLIGPALDWAVGVIANGGKPAKGEPSGWKFKWLDAWVWPDMEFEHGDIDRWTPSTDWSQCGPLIEKHSVWLGAPYGSRRCWDASYHTSCEAHDGDTPLIAACRAIVDAKLGDVVRVPAELVQQPTEGSGDE